MDFTLTENQKLIAEGIRKFGEQHIRPKMMEWDEEQIFPVDLFKLMGKQGYIVATLSQRWQLYADSVDSVEQIATEFSVLDHFHQVAV